MIVISIGFYGVKGGVFTVLTGGGHHVLGPEESFIGDNNHLGLALVMVIPLMRYLQQVSERRWLRMALLASMILTAIAVLGTQSRGAFLGLAAMLLFLAIRGRHKLMLGALAIVMIPIALLIMPPAWFERMESIRDYRQDTSAMGRINSWSFAFNLASDRPLLGGGFDCFTPRWFNIYAPDPTDFHDAHSIYFEVLGEHGFIGLFVFLSLGFLVWRTCSGTISRAEFIPDGEWMSDLARMLQIGLFGYAVSGAFVGLAYFDLYYNFVAIAVATKLMLHAADLEPSRLPAGESQNLIPHRGVRSLAR
jgi:probable O-glycosylation ligase (exosortase A-associated)